MKLNFKIIEECFFEMISLLQENYVKINGKYLCKKCCFILQDLLYKRGFITKKITKNIYSEYGLEDHQYLLYKNYIIDPTWKQFFIDNRITKNKINIYQNKLDIYHSILVIEKNEINELIKNLLKINKEEFGIEFRDFKDIITYW